MDKKIRKPIPTSLVIVSILLVLSGMLIYFEQAFSAVLLLILVGFIGCIHMILWIFTGVFHSALPKKNTYTKYRNFAKFYLKDRRLRYNKGTFRKALSYGWIDIVTMCLLLGIREAFDEESCYEMVFEVIDGDQPKLLTCLLNAEFFAADYSISESQQTPVLYALTKGSLSCCQVLLKSLQKEGEFHNVKFETLKMPVDFNPNHKNLSQTELLMKLVASGDEKTIELLKKYLEAKQNYTLEIKTGVDVYARLSTIEATMEKTTYANANPQTIKQEAACQDDLRRYIGKNYYFAESGKFMIDGIYKKAQYIDSHKVPCEHCHGKGNIKCIKCEGTKKMTCPICHGEGKVACSKCKGKQKYMCWDVKKYIECQSCHQGEFACHKCDEKGLAVCQACEGRGTRKCSCPKSKKMKCPYCNKGFVPLKNGMYKKCDRCKDGLICSLCHNTGWVNEEHKGKEYVCLTCNGNKKVTCPTCNGKKKLRCSKAHEIVCDCQDGLESCSECEGKKNVKCDHCNGTGKNECQKCVEGYTYHNVQIDFKGGNRLIHEQIIGESQEIVLAELIPQMASYVIQGHPFVQTVYTLQMAQINKKDIQAYNAPIEKAIKDMIEKKVNGGIVDILEIAPLYYTILQFGSKQSEGFSCILINEQFYKTISD